MKGVYIPALLLLLLSFFFTLGSTQDVDEDFDDDSDEDEECNDEGDDKKRNAEKGTIKILDLIPNILQPKNPKKDCNGKPKKDCNGKPKKDCNGKPKKDCNEKPKKDCNGKPKKECDEKMETQCEGDRISDGLPSTSPAYTSTTESSASLTSSPEMGRTTEMPSSAPQTSRPITRTTESPSSSPRTSSAAIIVPVSIFLFLLVLLAAFLLWRYSHYIQCCRKLRGKDQLKMKPENKEVIIQPPVSYPQGSEDPAQLPPSGHVYQEISDVRVGEPVPGSSYSTVGFPYKDQKAIDKQPPDGQYSLLTLSNQ